MINCLHLSNDFLGSTVHSKLYEQLHQQGINQTVYVPMRSHIVEKHNKLIDTWPYRVIPSKLITKKYSILYKSKIKFLYNDISKKIKLNKITIVHATTLFSDGGIALKIKLKHNIPYIVTVRSTDISMFLKYRPDLIFKAIKILKNAEKIIFISHTLKQKFLNHYLIKPFRKLFVNKNEIIYNGIDNYWINNIGASKKIATPIKLLFVGRLIPRKNILKLCEAVINLNLKNTKYILSIVGYGLQEEAITKIAKNNPDSINFLGPINNKDNLKKYYETHHIFAMPSIGETFGLVYIEALTQKLPILYCKNESIDGVFTSKIGISCEPSVDAIMNAIIEITNSYESFEANEVNFEKFKWNTIGKKYEHIYKASLAKL